MLLLLQMLTATSSRWNQLIVNLVKTSSLTVFALDSSPLWLFSTEETMKLGIEEQLFYKNGQPQQHVGHNRSLALSITGLELRS